MTVALRYCLSIAAWLIAAAGLAQRATLPDPALDALVAAAVANAPETASARATADAARRRITPAGTFPDPFLSTTYQNDGRAISLGDAEGSFLGLMFSQTIPWPGKLSLASEAAESDARAIESRIVGRTALTLEARVRNAWYDLTLARAVDRVIDQSRSTLTLIEQLVRERYALGLAVQQDVLRAQIELARIEEQKESQAATISSRVAELNRLLGKSQTSPIETPDDLPSIAGIPSTDALLATAIARSPELAAAEHGIETGRIRVKVAKRNLMPDIVVSGGSMYRAGFEMGPMWQIGAGISVPLWSDRRQKNQIAEAEAELNAGTADADAVHRELELRTRERIAQLEATQRIAALYRDRIVPLDDLALESALASYQAGKVPFITVLDALNALYNDRAAYANRLAESAQWRVAIDEASLQSTTMSPSASMRGGTTQVTSQNPGNRNESASGAMPSMR